MINPLPFAQPSLFLSPTARLGSKIPRQPSSLSPFHVTIIVVHAAFTLAISMCAASYLDSQRAAVTGKARLFPRSLGGLTLESLNKYLSSSRAKYRKTNVHPRTTPMPIVGT